MEECLRWERGSLLFPKMGLRSLWTAPCEQQKLPQRSHSTCFVGLIECVQIRFQFTRGAARQHLFFFIQFLLPQQQVVRFSRNIPPQRQCSRSPLMKALKPARQLFYAVVGEFELHRARWTILSCDLFCCLFIFYCHVWKLLISKGVVWWKREDLLYSAWLAGDVFVPLYSANQPINRESHSVS